MIFVWSVMRGCFTGTVAKKLVNHWLLGSNQEVCGTYGRDVLQDGKLPPASKAIISPILVIEQVASAGAVGDESRAGFGITIISQRHAEPYLLV